MISTFVALQISLNRAESFLSFFKRTVETVLRDQNRLTSPVGVKSPDTNRRVARAMQSIFRRSKSYLRDRNQSVCGTKRNESFAVSQDGFWPAKRPRMEGLVVDSGLFKRNDEQAWCGYTRWEMAISLFDSFQTGYNRLAKVFVSPSFVSSLPKRNLSPPSFIVAIIPWIEEKSNRRGWRLKYRFPFFHYLAPSPSIVPLPSASSIPSFSVA